MSAYAIKCPNCGGSLDALGGGRQVVSLTCKYCGSVLDVEKNFKVLAAFKKVPLPDTPFRIGMKGILKGVEFTIIGMVAYSCVKGKSVGEDTWVDFMLFSPTHGYAWLSYEEGNSIFSRRTRGLPSLKMQTLSPKNKFKFNNQKYTFYEHYRAYITYVQGELTWIARRHDMIQIHEAIRPPFGLTLERNKNELEYSISEYMDSDEVFESFGITTEAEASFHPLKPFSMPRLKAFSLTCLLFAVISFAIFMFIQVSYGGSFIKEDVFNTTSREIPFQINETEHLVELDITCNVDNSWIYYDISVEDAQGEEVYALGEEISYYHGYEGGESWSEGSKSATAYFKVKNAGNYLLKFTAPENRHGVYTQVKIRENVVRGLYFFIFFIGLIFAGSWYLMKLGMHHTKLWKHTQEDDDD